MYIKGSSQTDRIITPALNLVSLLFKSISFINLNLKSLKARRYPGAVIISVDNLAFGGTGKTPLIIALGKALVNRGAKFAVVTRGYRSKYEQEGTRVTRDHGAGDVGDEAKLLALRFPDQDIFIGRDRRASIAGAISRGNKFILLDDGFQSTDIDRDIKVMLFNPRHPYFFLRNFKAMMKGEDYILYYKEIPAGARTGKRGGGVYYFELEGFYDPEGKEARPGDAPLFGFSALADNSRFTKDLSAFNLAGFKGFPDHHDFSEKDIHDLDEQRKALRAGYLVCTEKDFVKLKDINLGSIPLIYTQNIIKSNFNFIGKIIDHAERKEADRTKK